jgi:hypothetical protein
VLDELTDTAISKLLLTVRIIHIILITLSSTAILFLWFLSAIGKMPHFGQIAIIIEISPVLASVLALLIGYFGPPIERKSSLTGEPSVALFWNLIAREIAFLFVPIFTFCIGLMGTSSYIWLPILIITCALAIVTFPTRRRWAKWRRLQESSHQSTDTDK